MDCSKLGIDDPKEKLSCRNLTFLQFCRIPFKDDIPQFVQTLFLFMTGEDLRKLVSQIGKENKVSKQLEERTKKLLVRKETKRNRKRARMGLAEKP